MDSALKFRFGARFEVSIQNFDLFYSLLVPENYKIRQLIVLTYISTADWLLQNKDAEVALRTGNHQSFDKNVIKYYIQRNDLIASSSQVIMDFSIQYSCKDLLNQSDCSL